MRNEIPVPVAVVVGGILGSYYYNHRVIISLFLESGAPEEIPPGNCSDQVTTWLKEANKKLPDPLALARPRASDVHGG